MNSFFRSIKLFILDEDSNAVVTTTKAKVGELEVEIPGIDIDACNGGANSL
jgi:hypothetical protein